MPRALIADLISAVFAWRSDGAETLNGGRYQWHGLMKDDFLIVHSKSLGLENSAASPADKRRIAGAKISIMGVPGPS